jgi:diguanylate cyclase (GGDEF)-like protein
MNLDVPTLMAMESFVAICAGVILLMAWSGNRKEPALGLWGLSDILIAAGIFGLILGGARNDPLIMVGAGIGMVFAQGLQWKAARLFGGKPAPFGVVILGAAVAFCASFIPVIQNFGASLGLAFSAVYLIATIVALWPAGKLILPARWPIIGFAAAHAAVLSIGAYATWNGVHGMMPPIVSSFGLIHFESIIYALGTAVFLLALVKERSEAVARIAAGVDSLTGIANRAAFMDAAEKIMAQCRRDNAPVSVIMFDLDAFKAVNDTYGHAVGDSVIQKFCAVTAAMLRPDDVFGRLGGEEFAVVLPRSSIEPAFVRAERIRVGFAEACRMLENGKTNATVSGGVAVGVNADMTLRALLKFSDEALYQAKAAGRNRIRRAGQLGLDGGSSIIRVA